MSKVHIIEAQKEKINRTTGKLINKMRVAAYCRVSTDSDEQMNSYKSQVIHYKNLIKQNKEWEFVDIYADSGISGTQSDNRDEFQRMISDASKGLIDIIITKSISRFARNTMDTLKYVRLLKDENVAIVFEKENINTLTMNGEVLLTILSSLAQQESESLSANTKKGLEMKMERGELVGYQGCLGYDYDKESKSISINEEESKTVRYIFDRYTEGVGCFVIAQELTAMGAVTKKGNTEWVDTSVRGIVKNEKYKGDILMGKSFTVDPISKRRLDNFGESKKYYIENHHEPIISREQFDKAQEILSKRSKNFNQGRQNKYSLKYTFSSLLKCGYCGGNITRRRWHSGSDNQKDVWSCVTAIRKGKKNCPECKAVEETIIENAFVKAFNILCTDNKTVVEEFLNNVEEGLQSKDNKKRINKLNAEINSTEIKISKLIDLHLEDKIDKITYEEKYGQLIKTLKELKTERIELDTVQGEEKAIKERLSDFKKIFKNKEPLTEFDGDVFKTVVEEVVIGGHNEDGIPDPYMLTFIFKTGLNTKIDGHKPPSKMKKKTGNKKCTYQEDNPR
ncbi:recombinase family protein [Aminipila sp.]|uniref:recombinase family protein n=1 Tax=Aminipila sp. TaxID=2060095 RepID=UPI0028A006E6|nr:recombinase family protein [Aminipila sp.]